MITFKCINVPSGETTWEIAFYSSSGALLEQSSPTAITSPIQMSMVQNVYWLSAGTNNGVGYASITNPQLADGQTYTVDFQAKTITLVAASGAAFTAAQIIAMLLPWNPLNGPPVPEGFLPPWPWAMSIWDNIPGYPKVPTDAHPF